MHIFRFNPVFKKWVVLGSPMPHALRIEAGHLLNGADKKASFVAATHPRQPFLLDKPKVSGDAPTLHREEQPLGEYELLLYRGDKKITEWGTKEWGEWVDLAQARIRGFYANPHLHHVYLSIHTAGLSTVEGYTRVGDLMATSHPVAGAAPLFARELVDKLRAHERGYILHDGPDGVIYAPSAPLYEKEAWYILPEQVAFEDLEKKSRTHVAEALSVLVKAYLNEWKKDNFVIELHTVLGARDADELWWLRIYQQETHGPASLSVKPLPEKFVRDLSYLLGPGRV